MPVNLEETTRNRFPFKVTKIFRRHLPLTKPYTSHGVASQNPKILPRNSFFW
jgi:hypothetical protein